MPPSELFNLDNELVNQMLLAIPALEAHEQLLQMRVADYPTMKNTNRMKLFKHLNKLSNPSIIEDEIRPLTLDKLAEILNQG